MSRRRALWLSGIATLAVGAILAGLDATMRDTGGPGIVGFELAGSQAEAERILADWGERGQDAARWSLWLDFAFLAAYGTFGALTALALRSVHPAAWWRKLGTVVAGLMVAAAAFDALENVNLLLVLGGHGGTTAPVLAAAFASAKFLLIGCALVYLVAALVLRVARR